MKALVLAGGYPQIALINELKSQTVDKMVGEFLTSMQNLGYSKEKVIDILKRQD